MSLARHIARYSPIIQPYYPGAHTVEPHHNLPLQRTSFIGRERELEDVKQLLASRQLLTLTGAGGCGKTRLALQAAAEVTPDYPFRKPFGPGWALVGDAGYLKDSITAQGISDAFRDAELLARRWMPVFPARATSRKPWPTTSSCEMNPRCRSTI
jgi:hypothetical protein